MAALSLTIAACGDSDTGTSTDADSFTSSSTTPNTGGMTDATGGATETSAGPGGSDSDGTTTGGSNPTTGNTTDNPTTDGTTTSTGVECENDADGDGYGAGDNCLGLDCDDNNPDVWEGCMGCEDNDGDGYGAGCDPGSDCDDSNEYAWDTCDTCMDTDGDGYWVGCNTYPDGQDQDDCDDDDNNNWTPDGCANCVDADADDFWVGCDTYDNDKPGPDCNDMNAGVGGDDAVELCDGIPQNCANEIDPLPADEMCPPPGNPDPPNVNPIDGWICDPPMPGQDGCEIKTCLDQFFDVDSDYTNGCECAGTSRNFSLAECGEEMPGYLGSLAVGEEIFGEDLVLGVIPELDNGKGNGAEDWFWVEFPQNNGGMRPSAGIIKIDFETNQNNDYRFEVYDSCPSVAWDGIAEVCTPDPLGNALEWWFWDDWNQPPPNNYNNNVVWPNKVFVRVFRKQNPNSCSNYRLRIRRESD